ncbi:MAG: hypothetical protein EDM03_02205 [Porphyrobacter sp. IPPAS B-1204]|nr:MAG: hypothetical protein EDM03_02205 [Porphyrobacter sp. IPPAS B-1204]
MIRAVAFILAAAGLAVSGGGCLAAQEKGPITFAGDVFDVTGAGVLDLGDIDPVLLPYLDVFRARPLRAKIELDVTVDAAGTVLDCRAKTGEGLAEAGGKLCSHAQAVGRFAAFPFLRLDYAQANYRTNISLTYGSAEGETLFEASTSDYPFLDDRAIIFGDGVIPAEDQRLTADDVTLAPMGYPRRALQNEVTGRVIVAVEFDTEGKAASCRPIRSDLTARLAYETCEAAMDAILLKQPPDVRPYVLSVYWSLN